MIAKPPSRDPGSESGYVAILAALAILILVTVIGFSASRLADTELAMARNEIIYHRNFYLAEGAAMEAADRLSQAADLKSGAPPWMETVAGALDYASVRTYFANASDPGATVIPEPSVLDASRALFLAGVDGVAPGEGLDPDRPKIHLIAVYGRCEWEGVSIIKLGYRAAY